MVLISNILLLFSWIFGLFGEREKEDFYRIPFEIVGFLSFCLSFVF